MSSVMQCLEGCPVQMNFILKTQSITICAVPTFKLAKIF